MNSQLIFLYEVGKDENCFLSTYKSDSARW
jgi:hypothetical protein